MKTTDLYRHFITIDEIRLYGFNTISSVDNIFVIKLLFYFIAKLNNNYLLASVSTFITYTIFFAILYDKNKKEKKPTFYISYCIILFFALCNYYYVTTGIKNCLAFSTLGLAILLEESKKKKISKCLMICSIFMHGSSLFIILLYYLTKINFLKGKKRYFILFIAPLTGIIENIFSRIPISIFQYIASKIELYLLSEFTSGNQLVLFLDILFCALMILRCDKLLKSNLNSYEQSIINTIHIVAIFSIGSLAISKVIIERMLMFIAFLIPDFISISLKQNKIKKTIVFDIIYSLAIISYYIVRLISHTDFIML